MQAACVVTIGLLSLPSYSYAQILPDSGNMRGGLSYMSIDKIESLSSEGKVHNGFVTPIACGKHYLNYSGCYLWTPDKHAPEKRCFRTHQAYLLNKSLEGKKSWVGSMQHGFLMDINEPATPSSKGFPSGSGPHTNENGWRTGVSGTVIDCTPSEPIKPFILETITASNPLSLKFDYDFERGARENCLLAEHFSYNSSTRFWYDRTEFYCFEVDSNDEAMSIAESFRSAYSDDGAYIYGGAKDPNRKHFTAMLRSKQLAFTNLIQADAQIGTVSAEEAEAFYARTRATPEITSGKAAVIFAIDEKFKE